MEKPMRQTYPSDITKEQFEYIRELLESCSKKTHPNDYELYDVFCALLYLLKEGCRWRSIPHDFPKWQVVYYHFKKWKAKRADGTSILDEVLHELVKHQRLFRNKRQPETTMVIIDSKSIKTTNMSEAKGYDGGKKNSGNKIASGS
jgi:transposase